MMRGRDGTAGLGCDVTLRLKKSVLLCLGRADFGGFVKRIGRKDQRFDLIRLLDAFARNEEVSIRDSTTHVQFLSGLADEFDHAKNSDTLIHGLRTENMFAHVIAALGGCSMVKSEDAGEIYADDTALRIPDYRVVISADEQLLVEVKNHRSASLADYPVKSAYMDSLRAYADAVGLPLYFAIYWSDFHMWALVRHDRFDLVDGGYSLSFGESMKRSEMALLGDRLLGTTPPLEFRLLSDPTRDRHVEPSGEISFTVGAVELRAGGQVIDDPLEKRIAWFLLRYSGWDVVDAPIEVVAGDLISATFEVGPKERPSPEDESEEDFEFLGFMSQMLSRQYGAMTADESGVNLLTPVGQPSELGVLIPSEYGGDRLRLWRFLVQPDAVASAADGPHQKPDWLVVQDAELEES
jgi:hypothetical protein